MVGAAPIDDNQMVIAFQALDGHRLSDMSAYRTGPRSGRRPDSPSGCDTAHSCACMFREVRWAEDRVDHIARYAVTPQEVEDVLFGRKIFTQDDQDDGSTVVMRMKQEQIEALAAKWDATEAPDVEYEQVAEPAADPMGVYSLRLPGAVADQLRTAAERRGMRPAELAREWIAARRPATIRPTGSWPTSSSTWPSSCGRRSPTTPAAVRGLPPTARPGPNHQIIRIGRLP